MIFLKCLKIKSHFLSSASHTVINRLNALQVVLQQIVYMILKIQCAVNALLAKL